MQNYWRLHTSKLVVARRLYYVRRLSVSWAVLKFSDLCRSINEPSIASIRKCTMNNERHSRATPPPCIHQHANVVSCFAVFRSLLSRRHSYYCTKMTPTFSRAVLKANGSASEVVSVSEDAPMLEEHARSHEEGEQCPLCSDRTLKLTEHLIQVSRRLTLNLAESLRMQRVSTCRSTKSPNRPSSDCWPCIVPNRQSSSG